MKQNISKKDWDELSGDQKGSWSFRAKDKNDNTVIYSNQTDEGIELPTIGQMIEFLGEWLKEIKLSGRGKYHVKGGCPLRPNRRRDWSMD
jgi:hypothetical protein